MQTCEQTTVEKLANLRVAEQLQAARKAEFIKLIAICGLSILGIAALTCIIITLNNGFAAIAAALWAASA